MTSVVVMVSLVWLLCGLVTACYVFRGSGMLWDRRGFPGLIVLFVLVLLLWPLVHVIHMGNRSRGSYDEEVVMADSFIDQLARHLAGAWPTRQPVLESGIHLLAERVQASMGEVTTEWSLRAPEGGTILIDLAFSVTEEEARAMHARRPGYILVRRDRWTVTTEWEAIHVDH